MPQAPSGWSVTLDWRDLLNIGLALLAIVQFIRNRRTKRACNEVLRRESIQTAAHGFAEMHRMASDLETSVRKTEWEHSLDVAKRLIILLAEASGSWSHVLGEDDKDKFDAARTEVAVVEKSVSLAIQNSPAPGEVEAIKQRCISAAVFMAAIAGGLKAPPELQERSIVNRWLDKIRKTRPPGDAAKELREAAEQVREQ